MKTETIVILLCLLTGSATCANVLENHALLSLRQPQHRGLQSSCSCSISKKPRCFAAEAACCPDQGWTCPDILMKTYPCRYAVKPGGETCTESSCCDASVLHKCPKGEDAVCCDDGSWTCTFNGKSTCKVCGGLSNFSKIRKDAECCDAGDMPKCENDGKPDCCPGSNKWVCPGKTNGLYECRGFTSTPQGDVCDDGNKDKCCSAAEKPFCRTGEVACCDSGVWACPIKPGGKDYACDAKNPEKTTEKPNGPVCGGVACCDPLNEPSRNGNNPCPWGDAGCCADGSWGCSLGPVARVFVCSGNFVETPLNGRVCEGCCDVNLQPKCKMGEAKCCPQGDWECPHAKTGLYSCREYSMVDPAGPICEEDSIVRASGKVEDGNKVSSSTTPKPSVAPMKIPAKTKVPPSNTTAEMETTKNVTPDFGVAQTEASNKPDPGGIGGRGETGDDFVLTIPEAISSTSMLPKSPTTTRAAETTLGQGTSIGGTDETGDDFILFMPDDPTTPRPTELSPAPSPQPTISSPVAAPTRAPTGILPSTLAAISVSAPIIVPGTAVLVPATEWTTPNPPTQKDDPTLTDSAPGSGAATATMATKIVETAGTPPLKSPETSPHILHWEYVEPEWWDAVRTARKDDTEFPLKRCNKRPLPPHQGEACAKKPKTCFFERQMCDGEIPYPTTECVCNGTPDRAGEWSCRPVACPETSME